VLSIVDSVFSFFLDSDCVAELISLVILCVALEPFSYYNDSNSHLYTFYHIHAIS
jgi:hypothetical protein